MRPTFPVAAPGLVALAATLLLLRPATPAFAAEPYRPRGGVVLPKGGSAVILPAVGLAGAALVAVGLVLRLRR